jgi:TetR/AcrR family transcriptional regulator, regulator of autoinduction and epiphytic fitness
MNASALALVDAGDGASGAHPHVVGLTAKERGTLTRRRMAEAMTALLDEGDLSPTAREVARRAGVSVRLVFHHFEDVNALYRDVMALQASRYWYAVRQVDTDLALTERVDRTAKQRAKLFDVITPVRRAVIARAAGDAGLAEDVATSDSVLRDWLARTFARELGPSGRAHRELLDALDAAASWEAWDRLRRGQHLSTSAARRVMARTLTGLLAAP